jgi:hypothetical protein
MNKINIVMKTIVPQKISISILVLYLLMKLSSQCDAFENGSKYRSLGFVGP